MRACTACEGEHQKQDNLHGYLRATRRVTVRVALLVVRASRAI